MSPSNLRVYTSEPGEFTLNEVNFVYALAQITGTSIRLARYSKGLLASIDMLRDMRDAETHRKTRMTPFEGVPISLSPEQSRKQYDISFFDVPPCHHHRDHDLRQSHPAGPCRRLALTPFHHYFFRWHFHHSPYFLDCFWSRCNLFICLFLFACCPRIDWVSPYVPIH